VIKRANAAGVRGIVSIGYDLNASREALKIANEHEGIHAAVGIHPHNAKTADRAVLDSLRNLAQQQKVVAIGEIGLDYHRDLSPRAQQREAFEHQISLARELGLPVIVHDREAHSDVLQLLRKSGHGIIGVMHCFSGSMQTAEELIDMGYLISLAGPVTFPNARKLHQLVQQLPEETIVLETDCPWLAPQSKRGRRNEPAFMVETAHKVAELKGIQLDELAEVTSRNAKRLFRIP